MAADDVWILGIHMTKFGKHPDKDMVDLASEAVLGALTDGGVTMKDVGMIGAGNLMAANAGIGQQLQKQLGQTGIPVYNVANACATGATALRVACMAIKAGETDVGLAFGVEKLSGAGLLSGGSRKGDSDTWEPSGRYGAVAPVDGRIGTETMPGVFAQIGMEYGHRYGGTSFELFAKIAEKNHAHSTLNPLAAYQKKMTLEEIMGDVMIAYPNTRPMCSANCDGAAAAVVVSGAKLKTLSTRAAAARGEDLGLGAHDRPVGGGVPDPPRRQHPDPQRRDAGLRAGRGRPVRPRPGRTARLLRDRRARPLRQPHALRAGGAVDFFESGATWRDGSTPVNVSGGLESKGHPIAATGVANVWEVATHLRGEAGDRQIEGARVGLTHVIGLGSACGVHILEKAA